MDRARNRNRRRSRVARVAMVPPKRCGDTLMKTTDALGGAIMFLLILAGAGALWGWKNMTDRQRKFYGG